MFIKTFNQLSKKDVAIAGGKGASLGEMTKKELMRLIDICYREAGQGETILLLDRIKDIGFASATRAGLSIGLDDMTIPARKGQMIEEAKRAALIELPLSDA